jgi:hypothetical protein
MRLATLLKLLQVLTPASRATAFASQCIQPPNQSVTELVNDGMCVVLETRARWC